MVDNPKQSPITRAYLDAKAVIGGLPETERERSLFEALQASLQTQYDPDLHKKCEQDEEDLRWEVNKLEEELDRLKETRVGGGKYPQPLADIDLARNILVDRRLNDRAGSRANPAEARGLETWRETSEVLKQLADEVEAWRKLFDVEED